MIVILKPDADKKSTAYRRLSDYLAQLPNIKCRVHEEVGTQQTLTEIYLVGDTSTLDRKEIEAFEVVDRVVRASPASPPPRPPSPFAARGGGARAGGPAARGAGAGGAPGRVRAGVGP